MRELMPVAYSGGGHEGLQQTANALMASVMQGVPSVGSARIEVPVSIDGREVARATAWYMGEQLAWEERR